MSELIHDQIQDAAGRSPGSVALKYGTKCGDYGMLSDRINAAAEEFAAIGLKCGERTRLDLDLIVDNVELPRAEVGDLSVLLQSDRDGLMVSPIHFLGHTPPLEMHIL